MDQLNIIQSPLQRALLTDISSFVAYFSSCDSVTFESFSSLWTETDFGLLGAILSPSQIIWSLVQVGLFSPTRPFRDHQLLAFFILAFRSGQHKYKLSLEKTQVLLNILAKAKLLRDKDVEAALGRLFADDAFILVAEDFNSPYLTGSFVSSSSSTLNSSTGVPSKDQLIERIHRLESFLHSNPLFDNKLPKASFSKVLTLLEKYCEAKTHAGLTDANNQNELTSVFSGIQKIIDGYEVLLYNSKFSRNFTSPASTTTKSIRSRLSQTSLNPIAPSSTFPPSNDLFLQNNRPQSVPVNRMRRTSSLREADLDEFIETSGTTTNMPSLNFF